MPWRANKGKLEISIWMYGKGAWRERPSDLLCMSKLAYASELKEHDDNDDLKGITGRAA